MGYFFGFIFVALAVLAAILYSGTPHGGPTTACGPITFFNHSFTVGADCRYVSIGELVAAFLFFLIAIMSLLAARPRGR